MGPFLALGFVVDFGQDFNIQPLRDLIVGLDEIYLMRICNGIILFFLCLLPSIED